MLLLLSVDFFQKINFSKKFFQEHYQECQTVWIQIRIDVLSVLICVLTVCKGYQETTNFVTSRQRVEHFMYSYPVGLQAIFLAWAIIDIASSEGSSSLLLKLIWAFASSIYDKYQISPGPEIVKPFFHAHFNWAWNLSCS